MIKGFTNSATKAVYELIANRPDVYDKLAGTVLNSPATAPEEIRTFVHDYVKLHTPTLGDSFISDLLEAALKEVRFTEVRQQLQIEIK